MQRIIVCLTAVIVLATAVSMGQQPARRKTTPPPALATKEKAMAESDRDTLKNVMQAVLDADKLQKYYHIDELPDRKPLRIAKTDAVALQPELKKFGVPVVYEKKDDLAASGKAFLEFPRVIVNADLAYAEWAYSAEGIRGQAWLIKEDGRWRVGNLSMVEK